MADGVDAGPDVARAVRAVQDVLDRGRAAVAALQELQRAQAGHVVAARQADALAEVGAALAAAGAAPPVTHGVVRVQVDDGAVRVRIRRRPPGSAWLRRVEADLTAALGESARAEVRRRRDALRAAAPDPGPEPDVPELADAPAAVRRALDGPVARSITASGEGEDPARLVVVRVRGDGDVQVRIALRARRVPTLQVLATAVEQAWARASADLGARVLAELATAEQTVD